MPLASGTFEAHRLILMAGRQGLAEPMTERLFRAHFTDGLHIGDPQVLAGPRHRGGRADRREGGPRQRRRAEGATGPGARNVCPPGHGNLQVMTLCPPGCAYWGVSSGPAADERYRRNHDYQQCKAQLTESILSAAETALGPLRDHIVHLETATPLTHERYTLATGGTPYGLSRWGATGSRPDTRSTIEGLHTVGASTRYGSGIAGAAVSGMACATRTLDRRLLPEVHRGAVLGDPDLLPRRTADWDPLAVSRGARRRDARGLARIG